ncbi:MAG: hypothetical protein R2780_03250 [Crocinitomicaceae bacterium]
MSIFQEAAIQRGAPTKGAISYGRFTADFEKSIFYGQPLIDAYLLQDELYYYGIIADNNVQAFLGQNDKIETSEVDHYFLWTETPLKRGMVNHLNIKLDSLTEDQLNDLYNHVSGSVRKYVDNTIKMYELMNKK